MLKVRKPKACLTKGSFTGCDTRWHGLESIGDFPDHATFFRKKSVPIGLGGQAKGFPLFDPI